MEYVVLIIGVISLIVSGFCLIAVWRLYKYIRYVVEDKLETVEEKANNLIQTLKIIVKEGLIQENGRIKKPYIMKNEEL